MLKRICVCKLCNTGECEDKINFMFACPSYNDIRESILEPVFKNPLMLVTEKLLHLMKLKHREALNCIEKACHKRHSSDTYIVLLYENTTRCNVYALIMSVGFISVPF